MSRLQEEDQELWERQQEVAETLRRLDLERRESATTLPPPEIIQAIEQGRARRKVASRKQERLILRQQKVGLLMALALSGVAAALVWWGIRIMQ